MEDEIAQRAAMLPEAPDLEIEVAIEVRHQLRECYSGEVVLKPAEIGVSSQEAAFLEQVKAVVEQHLGDANFNVDCLAEKVGLSPRQLQRRLRESAKLFSRLFRQVFGVAPSEFTA